MLIDATGEPVTAVGDSFVVHMDREALNDYPMGRYDVTVTITAFVPDREIAWTVLGQIRPPIEACLCQEATCGRAEAGPAPRGLGSCWVRE